MPSVLSVRCMCCDLWPLCIQMYGVIANAFITIACVKYSSCVVLSLGSTVAGVGFAT